MKFVENKFGRKLKHAKFSKNLFRWIRRQQYFYKGNTQTLMASSLLTGDNNANHKGPTGLWRPTSQPPQLAGRLPNFLTHFLHFSYLIPFLVISFFFICFLCLIVP